MKTPLLAATIRGHEQAVTLLLDHGADPNVAAAGYSALHWAAGSSESTLTGPFGIQAESGEWSVLGGLRGETKRAIVKALLAHGADPNVADEEASTPVMFAAQHGHAEIIRRLLDAGADLGARGDHGLTALGFARQNGHGETAALLEAAGGPN